MAAGENEFDTPEILLNKIIFTPLYVFDSFVKN